ncbi:asparagine synthase-related protein [Thermoflavifilum thermophilum]|uniref:Asparagine synthase (Glutamine-hydrolysing) n=1 Tax=Thermoflavifilum thermophilum TaxID=1393122 RepID=A0A1I7N8Q5_9BACT|nr:asparagine synthase-related protein [Thermoflavifilum thermophilum]SFV31035.1 asparagine synthase (glutamine-hydrolysing) [Thermoflavifilum thermophilum]
MSVALPVQDFVNLLDNRRNVILNMTLEEAEALLLADDPRAVSRIRGQFALVVRKNKDVYMARSIGRPMRYFLAKQADGPLLIVAERIDEIFEELKKRGLEAQFHPSYTRMVPAHYVVRLQLIGCPDPNPVYERYFEPKRNHLPADLDMIGRAYIGALADVCQKWLMQIPATEPVGVLFSGGIDSGSVFLVLYHLMLQMGMSPQRLKAFTLSVQDESGQTGLSADARQAQDFLHQLGLDFFLEIMQVPASAVDYREAIRVIEDYKPLDVEAAAMTLALCKQIRQQYPEWQYLADGDGGDENLKDYPIEENSELTIRSVLNNPLLYHEGWGVDKIKHSLTYTGGMSRGHVRTYAPARLLGFQALSPYVLPQVIEVSEGIPFIELTQWNHEKLYALKGEIVKRGVKAITGMDMPVYPKRRFQQGAIQPRLQSRLFPGNELVYRQYFQSLYA